MPPRLSKRQQRELEELEVLKKGSAPTGESDSGEEAGPSQARTGGTFSNVRQPVLMQPHDSGLILCQIFAAQDVEDDDEEEEEEMKTAKSKKVWAFVRL